jgi:hypothetical protein
MVQSAATAESGIPLVYTRNSETHDEEAGVTQAADIPLEVSGCCYYGCMRFAHWMQAMIITGSCGCCKCLLGPMRILDMLLYSINRTGFNEARRRSIGPMFCALGKVNLVGYREVKALLTRPQTRGPYLGRAKLISERCPAHFLLFESNHAPDGQPHRDLRAEVVKWAIHHGQTERAADEYAHKLCEAFARRLVMAPSNRASGQPMENVNGTCSVDFPLELLRTFVVGWLTYLPPC